MNLRVDRTTPTKPELDGCHALLSTTLESGGRCDGVVSSDHCQRPGRPGGATGLGRPPRSGRAGTARKDRPGCSTGLGAPPSAEPDPGAGGPKDRAPAVEAPARPGPDRRPARDQASTGHAVLVRCRLNRLTHVDRATGEPNRRWQHDRPGDLNHVDVKKFGRVPEGGGWCYVGRLQGGRTAMRRWLASRPEASNLRVAPARPRT